MKSANPNYYRLAMLSEPVTRGLELAVEEKYICEAREPSLCEAIFPHG